MAIKLTHYLLSHFQNAENQNVEMADAYRIGSVV